MEEKRNPRLRFLVLKQTTRALCPVCPFKRKSGGGWGTRYGGGGKERWRGRGTEGRTVCPACTQSHTRSRALVCHSCALVRRDVIELGILGLYPCQRRLQTHARTRTPTRTFSSRTDRNKYRERERDREGGRGRERDGGRGREGERKGE
jgi:hypothetical protein